MSTRANVIIKDSYSELIFYRHSDGYPEGTLPSLEKFIGWAREGRIRRNVGQAAGWLILLGANEEDYRQEYLDGKHVEKATVLEPATGHSGWKCGAYEPTDQMHGDIEFLYVVDLDQLAIHIDGQDGYTYEGKYGSFAKAKANF